MKIDIDKEIENYFNNDYNKMIFECNVMFSAVTELLIRKNIITNKELEEMQEYIKDIIIQMIKLQEELKEDK